MSRKLPEALNPFRAEQKYEEKDRQKNIKEFFIVSDAEKCWYEDGSEWPQGSSAIQNYKYYRCYEWTGAMR